MAGKGDELVFLPLGGVGEIGMNFALYGYGPANAREWIVVDCGVTFPGPDLPGADLVLPDVGFVERERERLRGIVITHAHEDHYGALPALWPILKAPVWATPFTAGLLRAKRGPEDGDADIPITIYHAGETFHVGPFAIEAVCVTHSIPEPVSLAIMSPAGTVIHTGDWKIDDAPASGEKTDEVGFRQLGDNGVLALVCDSTNAMRDGVSPSEEEVGASLKQLIEDAPGRVAITTFSSNVGRIRSIAKAAREAGRKVLVLGRSLKRVIDVAGDLGYMDGIDEFLSEEDFQHIRRDQAVIICTGSQGESRAALAKLARDELRNVALDAGDTVICSSRIIPGNEKPILEIKNRLIERGIRVIEDDDTLVHVSGHPRKDELKQMYEWVRPEISVPVHGESAHLAAHGSLASGIGVPQVAQMRNGDMLRLSPGPAEIIGQVDSGRIFKDGNIIGSYDKVGIRDRKKLSYVGHVAVNVVLDDRFELAGDPDLVSVGVPDRDANGAEMDGLLLKAATGAIESIPRVGRKDLDRVAEAARRAVRAAARDAWGKKPVVTVFVTQ